MRVTLKEHTLAYTQLLQSPMEKVHASIMHILRKPEAGTNTTYNSDMSHSPAIAFLFSRLK